MPKILKAALDRGRGRWSDRPYLIRIIFSEMIKDDILSETGFGIDYKMGDGGTEIYIDSEKQNVKIGTKRAVSFEKFCE